MKFLNRSLIIVVAALSCTAQVTWAMQAMDVCGNASDSEAAAVAAPDYFSAGVIPVFHDVWGMFERGKMIAVLRPFCQSTYVVPRGQKPDPSRKALKRKSFCHDSFNAVREKTETPWQTACRAFEEQTGMVLPSDARHDSVHVKMIAAQNAAGNWLRSAQEFKRFSGVSALLKEGISAARKEDGDGLLPEDFKVRREDHHLFFAQLDGASLLAAACAGRAEGDNPAVCCGIGECLRRVSDVEAKIRAGDMETCWKIYKVTNETRDGVGDPAYPLVSREFLISLPAYPRLRTIAIMKALAENKSDGFSEEAFDAEHRAQKEAYYSTNALDLKTSYVKGSCTCVHDLRPELEVQEDELFLMVLSSLLRKKSDLESVNIFKVEIGRVE